MEFTQGVDNVKFTQVPNNIASYQALLNEIDNQVIQDSGENLVASYQSPAQQLGTVEIIENNRATRVKSMDISRDFLISQVLQHTLDNITQFAWKLTKKETEETTSSGIKTIKIQNPVIIVPDVKITQKNKKIIKEEDEGNFGFFEFKEDMIKARYRVKVSTASNANMQKIMEKNSFTQYINNKVSLRNINPELIDQNELKNISRYMDLVW
ncbi:MAG: hypothetical protein LBU27_09955 [Candidatus Peribacteria bacterium]|jgi:hypothetical protein|nr:hypothetical protein [Candidatus Peribacteria bacterium]